MKWSIALFVFLFATKSWAKPFYLTVSRDFSPEEHPVVELVYQGKAPFSFRVYKPKDEKEFIASQIDLSRAWRQPAVKDNPARYLLQGLNESKMGFDWVRATLDPEIRKPLKGKFGGGDFVHGKTNIPVGPEKIIAAPDQFEMVSEFSVLADEKDQADPFDVPGFNWWFGRYGQTNTRMVKLPKLPAGFYVLQVVQGAVEGQVLLVVNDIAAQVQQTSGEGIVRVVSRSGEPVSGAKVSLRNVLGKWVGSGSTNGDGEWSFSKVEDQELIAVVEHKDSVAIVDTNFLPAVAVFPDLYLYSDRPLYRPGDSIEFRGILRDNAAGLTSGWTAGLSRMFGMGERVSVHLQTTSGADEGAPIEVAVSDFGTFSGKLSVPEGATGVYRITATLNGADHAGEVRVKDYVKPLFFVRVKSKQETVRAGESIDAEVEAERYGGGIPAEPRYKIELYRTRVETPQWVDDAGFGETGSEQTYGFVGDYRKPKNLLPVLVSSTDYQPMENGKATISVKVPAVPEDEANFDHTYVLQVTVGDEENQFITGSASFIDTKSEVVAQAKISKTLVAHDSSAVLRVRSVYPSGKTYSSAKGEIEWWVTPYRRAASKVSAQEFATDKNGRFQVKVPQGQSGFLEARVSLRDGAGHESRTAAFTIVAGKENEPFYETKEALLLASDESVTPGSMAHAQFLLPEKYGRKGSNEGTVYVTIAGSRIFEHRVLRVEGNHVAIAPKMLPEYGTSAYLIASYFDSTRGWQERKIGFRIFPNQKILKVAVHPVQEIVAPGGNQSVELRVVDNTGKPAQAELSVSVVDQAVLDLQPEFRPSLIDFFYPMGRLNLMSFFSSEFQSYGYGERLASLFRPNFRLGATKTPNDRKQDERDTAYWTADLKTDASGKARVQFALPSNQTHWIVTAVANDKAGRFGEGKGEFRAKTTTSGVIGAPSFLRRGDDLDVRFEVSNNGKKDWQASAFKVLPQEGLNATATGDSLAKVASGQTASIYRRVSLQSLPKDGKLSVGGHADSADQPLDFRQTIRGLTDRVPVIDSETFQSDKAHVRIGAKETLDSVEVLLTEGLSGYVMPALDWMTTYPYGCVEQTTSTTIPNIAVKRVLQQTHAPEYAEVDRRASANVQAGLERLAAFRSKDGSYGWYSAEADENMTLNVLMALAELESGSDMTGAKVPETLGWLKQHVTDKSSAAGACLSYVQAKLQEKGIGNTVAEFHAQLKLQGQQATESKSPLYQAFYLLALEHANLQNHPEFAKSAKEVTSRLQDFVRKGSFTDLEESHWPGYVGRAASATAIIGDALFRANAMQPDLQRNLTTFLMSRFNGENFGSTYESAQVLIHSDWLMLKELEVRKTDTKPELKWNGMPVPPQSTIVRPTLAGWRVQFTPATSSGQNEVAVNGRVGLAGKVLARKSTSIPDAEKKSQGWQVTKNYFLLDEKTGEKKPLDGNFEVKVGDLVYVELTYQRSDWPGHVRWASDYYLLKDSVPAGFTVLDEDKKFETAPYQLPLREVNYARREVRPEIIDWFFGGKDFWRRSIATRAGYVMRASYAGAFSAGPALVKEFYDEDRMAATGGRRIVVRRLGK